MVVLILSRIWTSIKQVAPSPSQAIDFARPCITWKESFVKILVIHKGIKVMRSSLKGLQHTASRQACRSLASVLSNEDILFDPESPLAKAMTASLVLVSPSTCRMHIEILFRIE